MNKQLAFVLSGGGSHGALQVGALRALFEAGFKPELATGTSIGAANSAFLAVHGFNLEGLQSLEAVWRSTIDKDLMPTNFWWQMMLSFFKRSSGGSQHWVRQFAIQNGLTPELRFRDIRGVRLYLVASDLNAGAPVIAGLDPDESVLEGMLASMALPPWFAALEKDGRLLVDGAAVSNLPIETAVLQGATEIIALHLAMHYEVNPSEHGLAPLLWKLDRTVENRQLRLELELAEARGVAVRYIRLLPDPPVPFWDFRHALALMEQGHQAARRAIESW